MAKYDSRSDIHIALPVSGAAVGLGYSEALIDRLTYINSRYQFSSGDEDHGLYKTLY